MARPKKNNADYFSHDSGMRNDAKLKAVRRKFGIVGYGVYNMLIEHLTDCDFFEYEYSELNIELLSGDFDIETDDLKKMIEYFILLKLISKKDGKIYSKKLKERFESLINKRVRQSSKKQLSTTETQKQKVIVSDNPQSKVKESKVKETKVSKYEVSDFLKDWNELRTQHLKKPSFIKKLTSYDDENSFKALAKDYNAEDFKNAMIGLFKQKKMPNGNSTMQSNPSHFLKFFNSYITAYHDKNTSLYGTKKDFESA